MDLIANALAFLFGFAGSIYGNILATDICATADARCEWIIGRAVARLAEFDRDEMERDWLSNLHECDTVQSKYAHAIGCWLAAPQMRRRALTLRIALQFKVASVGTVPFNLTIDPIFGARLLNLIDGPKLIVKPLVVSVIVYHFTKVLCAVHRLGPGSLHRFLNECHNIKKWDVDVHVTRKGFDFDASKLVKLYMLDKTKGQEAFNKLAEIFSQPAKPAVLPSEDRRS